MSTETSAMSLKNIDPNILKNYLPFDSYEKITVPELITLFKKLMEVDWVFAEKTVNLSKRGWTIGWNNRKKALGVCRSSQKRIEISKYLLNNNLDKPNVWEDTIRHEIAHAIEVELRRFSDHGRIWKRICRVTGANPTRVCDNPLNMGDSHKFELVCPSCNYTSKYFRKPKANKACGDCCNKHNFGRYSKDYKLELKKVA